MKVLILLVILVAVFTGGREASVVYACSCAGTTPDEAFESSDAVFIGSVARFDHPSWAEQLIFGRYRMEITFEVSEAWKGPNRSIIILKEDNGSSTCVYPFHEGRFYLVYAKYRDGQLQTTLCSGTKSLSSARNDIVALNQVSISTRPDQQPSSAFLNTVTILLFGVTVLLFASLFAYLKRTRQFATIGRFLSGHSRTRATLILLMFLSLGLVVVNMLAPNLVVGVRNALPLACPIHRPAPVLTRDAVTEVMKTTYSSSDERWDLGQPVRYAYCNRSTERWWQGLSDGGWGQISEEGVPGEVKNYASESDANLPLYRVFACSNDTGQLLREEGWVDGMTGKIIARIPVTLPSGVSDCDYYWV